MSSNYQHPNPKGDQKNPAFYPSDRNLSATDSYDHLLAGDVDRGTNTKPHRQINSLERVLPTKAIRQ